MFGVPMEEALTHIRSPTSNRLNEDLKVREMASQMEAKVLRNEVMSGDAAHQIVQQFMKGMGSS
jgi:hypothetical protein